MSNAAMEHSPLRLKVPGSSALGLRSGRTKESFIFTS